MSHLVDNRALLLAFREGEKTALAEVYRLYAPALIGFLRRGFSFESRGRTVMFAGRKSGFELENLVQETFARAFAGEARQRYDGLRPYASYLLTIARNLVADEYRQRTRAFVPLDDVSPCERQDETSAPPPSPDEQLETKQLQALIAEFRATLASDEAGVFALRFGERLTIDEVAARLGTTDHHVKRMEQHLRKRFFVLMRRHGYLEGRLRAAAAAAEKSSSSTELRALLPLLASLAAGSMEAWR